MSLSEQYNVGARIKAAMATTSLSISQTTATAATTQDGLTIDRNLTGRRRFYSCKAIGAFSYVAATTAITASLNIRLQHSSDGTSWDNLSTGTAVTFGADTGGTTDYDTVELSQNLNGVRRYLRVQIPPPTYSNSSSGQGVFTGGAVLVFGGGDELPAQ
jgi:hypothetical protein